MDDETFAHMRDRMERCRRLAKSVADRTTAKALEELADEIEADLKRHGKEPGAGGEA